MEEGFFKAQQVEGGYTLTLTSRLGLMLLEAEELFGERDKSWTVLGIEFEESGPYVWYPADSKNVLIRLSLDVENDLREACWELSHEVIHLLSPSGSSSASVLEEGLAVYYSKQFVMDNFGYDHPNNIDSYDRAYELVKPVLKDDPHIIKKMRVDENRLSKIDERILSKHLPNLPAETLAALAAKFPDKEDNL